MDLTSISSAARMQPPDFAQMREKMFKKADADGSGTLTKDELADAVADAPTPPGGGEAPDVDEMFSRMDADGDGLVTQEEHDSALEEMDADRGQGSGPGPMSFDGSTNALQTLLSALQSKDTESGTTSSTDLEDLLDRLLSQLNQGGTYSSSGSTKGSSFSSFFESSS